MTAVTAQAFGCVCLLILVDRYRPAIPGTLLYIPRTFEPADYVSTLTGWSPAAEIAAAAEYDDAGILDGGGHLPMTPGEFAAVLAVDPGVAAALDTIEAELRAELDWRIASALLWLGADLETEHTLASLADYDGDPALREKVLSHA